MAKLNTQAPFVISALLAGRLYRMLETTKVMRISSSNAKCISIRGGVKTTGFKPITDFISEMAKDTISISSKINSIALSFSRNAVNEARAATALNSYKRVIELLDNQSKKEDLQLLTHTIQEKVNDLQAEQYKYCKVLNVLFDDISQRIRAAKIIVTNSRTEASRAGEYKTNLFAIADDLQSCSENIANEIKVCRNYLNDLSNMTG